MKFNIGKGFEYVGNKLAVFGGLLMAPTLLLFFRAMENGMVSWDMFFAFLFFPFFLVGIPLYTLGRATTWFAVKAHQGFAAIQPVP